MSIPRCELSLGSYLPAVEERLLRFDREGFAERLWRKDPTLWSEDPVPELADRLGWLDLAEASESDLEEIRSFAASTPARRVLLLGMGGSSLAPEVFARLFPRDRQLEVLDSTHPSAVAAATARSSSGHTLYVVSSKSGTTVETSSLCAHFLARERRAHPERAGERFVAITDEGTPLEALAREKGFAAVFRAPAEVGGRYSALSRFGLVPAALVGVDLGRLLASAAEMAAACRSSSDNPGLTLGAMLGELALAGRDKLTLLADPALASFPDWLEQLVAESLGKVGRGVVPVAGEGDEPHGARSDDRVFVGLRLAGEADPAITARISRAREAGHPTIEISLEDRLQIGAEIFRWEAAVAVAGAVLGVQPFDQPDVQAAKDAAKRAMARTSRDQRSGPSAVGAGSASLTVAVNDWLAGLDDGDYVAIQAFLDPASSAAALANLRGALWRRTGGVVTAGHGPRFLHSTGQLHKGGPDTGRFLQLIDSPAVDVAVPGGEHTFGQLIRAQAAGDAEALAERGRRVLVVDLGEGGASAVGPLIDAIG
jgi:transaldolase/glucose-6-phosphate isomerase